ncbi:MAG: GNAT family N-acetyltransferase [Dehalococcoidia bacterium]|jgi:RimJ/RimL family protein N-acetyltransferase|nr:GNAT family N-acetyltransferase [Dehalococcoidia bacterium]
MLTPKDDVVARGRRTILRRKRMTDVVQDYAWRADEELAAYDAAPPLRMPFQDYARTWELDMRFTDAALRNLAIEDEEGRRIGNIMYYNVDRWRQEAELGISIGLREYWGRGYGSDAVETIVHHLFRATSLRRLYLHTLTWNVRAQRAFRKAGFVPCGTAFRNGHAFVVMEVHRETFAAP